MAHESRLLIVDNHEAGDEKTRTRRIRGFVEHLEAYNARISPHGRVLSPVIIPYDRLDTVPVEADGAILTGSGIRIDQLACDPSLARALQPQIDLICSGKMPILGVCFGHQLIAHAFGFSIGTCSEKEGAIMPVEVHEPFELIKQPSVLVENHHQREVTWVPALERVFSVHASTAICRVQVLKHKVLPVYGVQFHPESLNSRARLDGQALLHNFFDIVVFKDMLATPVDVKVGMEEIGA